MFRQPWGGAAAKPLVRERIMQTMPHGERAKPCYAAEKNSSIREQRAGKARFTPLGIETKLQRGEAK